MDDTGWLNRVNVVGCSGSGKSALSQRSLSGCSTLTSKWTPFFGRRIGRNLPIGAKSGSMQYRPILHSQPCGASITSQDSFRAETLGVIASP